METRFDTLATQALALPEHEREAFIQLLIESLSSHSDIDDAWEIEIDRRIAEIESGTVKCIPIADALAQLHANLK